MMTRSLSVLSLAVLATLSMAPNRRAHDHIGNFNFTVEIDGVPAGSFRSVDGLEAKIETVSYQDGNDLILRAGPLGKRWTLKKSTLKAGRYRTAKITVAATKATKTLAKGTLCVITGRGVTVKKVGKATQVAVASVTDSCGKLRKRPRTR